jgi:predicted amidophosphoribosyltransferase
VPTVEDFTDPHVATYVPPPQAGDGICQVCHGATSPGRSPSYCDSCDRTRRQVSRPLDLVVPISLYVGTEQLHTVLRGYKDSPDKAARDRFRFQVAALLGRFLRDHGDCVRAAAGRGWDTLTIVPSTAGRAGGHPFEDAILMARAHRPLYRRLLQRTDAPIGHNAANEAAYRASGDAQGARVLLLDDTFTTGARVQSAASRLTIAGADVVAAVVVGRFMRPDYSDQAGELWERRRVIPFDFATCCVHV